LRLGALSFTQPLVLYHGTGRGWTMLEHDIRPSAAKRMAWGPGFYLTTNPETARKYAKGGGRVLRFELDPELVLLGSRATATLRFELAELLDFVARLPRKRREIAAGLQRIDERAREAGVQGPTVFAEALVNLAANEGALTGDVGPAIARWYVAHGVDGAVERSRGYAGDEDWVILWNMRKIRDHRFLAPREDPAPSPRLLMGL